jgi:hypothetical protein
LKIIFKIASFWKLGPRCCAPFTIKKFVADRRHAYESCGGENCAKMS